jgi:hypothetical protein
VVTWEPELTVGGVHGGHGRGSGRAGGNVVREEEGSKESYGGGRPESDAWGRREAGGGTDLVARWRAAAKSGSGRRQAAWHGRERPARGWEGGGEAGVGTWTGVERRWGGGGAAHGRQSGGGTRAERKQRSQGWRRKTRTGS